MASQVEDFKTQSTHEISMQTTERQELGMADDNYSLSGADDAASLNFSTLSVPYKY
jgi:hypothetical protein